MSRYTMFHAVVMSFYSRNLYRDVAYNWGGKAILYLLLLILLTWIPFCYEIQQAFNLLYNEHSETFVRQAPVLTFKDGRLTTPENRPYFIVDPETKQNVVVIDTTGKYKTLEEAKTSILITQTQWISQPKRGETRINDIPKSFNFVLNPNVVADYIGHYLGYLWVIIIIIFTITAFTYRIIEALIYALIGKIVSNIRGTPITYNKIYNITLVALTPVIILTTILDFFMITFHYQWLLYFFLAMFYLFYGLAANKVQPPAVK